jgi:hypothetical protein
MLLISCRGWKVPRIPQPSSPSDPRLRGTEVAIRKVSRVLLISCRRWKVLRIPPTLLPSDPRTLNVSETAINAL